MITHEQAKTLLECIEQAQEREGDWLVALEQAQDLAKLLVTDTESHPADAYSYAPCITGKVEIGDQTSEFMIPLLNDSMGWTQWGADNHTLGPRVELLDKMSGAANEWAQENITEEDDDDD